MFASLTKTVAAAATAEALSATSLRVSWCTIQLKAGSTGTAIIKGPTAAATGGFTLSNPGDSFVIWSPASLHLAIDLAEVFCKVSVNGEGVDVSYVK